MPYAFTEQGIGQLSSVVHSQKAIERSIVIMNPEQGVLIVQNTLFVMSFENFEEFTTNVDYNDIRLIGEVNI